MRWPTEWRPRNETADAGDPDGAAAQQEPRAFGADAAEGVDRYRGVPRESGETVRAERPGVRVARRGEHRREQGRIGAGGSGQAQRRMGMGGGGDQPVPLPADRAGASDGAFRQMDPVRADVPRERGVFAHQQNEAPPARDGGEAACEQRALRHAIVTEDDGAPRRQRAGRRERIGEARVVRHEHERGQGAAGLSFEARCRLC